MPVETYFDRARERVRAERGAVDAKLDALERFVDRVRELPPDRTGTSSSGLTATTGVHRRASSTTTGNCQRVRAAFAETVRPHSVDDVDDPESLLETVRAEFTETIAVALAPTTEASFTPELKATVLSEAETRRTEAGALDRALAREATQLDEASDVVDELLAWIADADETRLSAVDFDGLRRRHETLADYRGRCETLAEQRQAFLAGTTSNGVEAGIRHRELVPYLYRDFPVDHPLLATVARLDATCEDCQRTVRDHLTRRA